MKIMIIEDVKDFRDRIRKCLEALEIVDASETEWLESDKFSYLEQTDLSQIDLLILDRQIHGRENSWEWLLAQKARNRPVPKTVLISGKSDADSFADYEQKLSATAVCKHPPDQFNTHLQKVVDGLLCESERHTDIRDRLMATYDQSMLSPQKDGIIVGICDRMVEVQRKVRKYAPKDIPVLITGPTGSGKDLVAQQLHDRSPRKDKKFRSFVSQELPDTLLASELFGIKKGHFTGASQDIAGVLAETDGGTLFLDEIADMPLNTQVMFLRFLEDKSVRKVGEAAGKRLDIRIIAATNKNLREEMEAGRFREDLYYRLAAAQIEMPGLNQRSEADMDLLLEHFIRATERQENKPLGTYRIAQKLRDAIAIARYSWPGNVREFRNCIVGALADGDDDSGRPLITERHLPHHVLWPAATPKAAASHWLKKLVEQEPHPVSYARIQKLQHELAVMFLRPIYATSKSWNDMCRKCQMDEDGLRKLSKMSEEMRKIYREVTGG